MAKAIQCPDCLAEGIKTTRDYKYPAKRCYSHHRAVVAARKARARNTRIEKTYGITEEQYAAVYAAQGGRCAICQRATGAAKKLAVDHDHATGLVRGCLCTTCNKYILGHARDDVAFFQRAIDYLNNPPAFAVIGRIKAPIENKREG